MRIRVRPAFSFSASQLFFWGLMAYLVVILVMSLWWPEVFVKPFRGEIPAFAGARAWFVAGISRYVREPEAALLVGLLAGDTKGLPREVILQFRASGLGHIVAVSGYNVTKLVGIIVVVTAWCGARRRMASVCGVLGVGLFVCFAGVSPSLVRAAVMAGFSTMAFLMGRHASSWRVLVYTAGAMLLVAPGIAAHDLGFTLSFLAVLGLALAKDPFEQWLWFLPNAWGMRGMAAETCAATLFVSPFSFAVFGVVPFFGILANLMVLPLIPLVMLLGVLVLLGGLVLPVLGVVFGTIATLVLSYILHVTAFFAQFPAAHFSLGLWQTIGIYVVIVAGLLILRYYPRICSRAS